MGASAAGSIGAVVGAPVQVNALLGPPRSISSRAEMRLSCFGSGARRVVLHASIYCPPGLFPGDIGIKPAGITPNHRTVGWPGQLAQGRPRDAGAGGNGQGTGVDHHHHHS